MRITKNVLRGDATGGQNSAFLVAMASIAIILTPSWAKAQAPSLREQLNAQYKLVKMGSDSNGPTVLEPGTLLAVQRGGILSTPEDVMWCPAKFQENTLHPSGGFCVTLVKAAAKYFQTGEKVYPIKLNVNLSKEKISFMVVACDTCNGTDPPTAMRGEVVFQFSKGYLEKANAAEVEDTIGQVFSVVADEEPGQGGPQAEGGQEQSEPKTVQLGMTTKQVQDVLGKPDKIFDLGAKQIYVYKDIKITLMNGKVSDVQ